MDKAKTRILQGRQNAGDHLANERTFLAWIRTSIAIMGLGFVVVKFSIFVRQIALAVEAPPISPQTGYSHIIGVALVGLGILTIIFSFGRYVSAKRRLDKGDYLSSDGLIKLMSFLLLLLSLFLLIYLLKTT